MGGQGQGRAGRREFRDEPDDGRQERGRGLGGGTLAGTLRDGLPTARAGNASEIR